MELPDAVFVLREISFAVASIVECCTADPGSHERALAKAAYQGIRADIDYCIAQIESERKQRTNP